LSIHAIYVVLNEASLLRASLASVYDYVDGATVITGYDRDWQGGFHQPDDLVNSLLDRSLDPDRKVNLVVTHESNEARSRNRAMDFACPSDRSQRVLSQHAQDHKLARTEYFWIIDADEIYESKAVPGLIDYVRSHRKPFYQVASYNYFKRWNYRIDGLQWFTSFVRSDRRCGALRNPYPGTWSKLVHRVPALSEDRRSSLLRISRVPPDIATFHHGTYVGPRQRIEAKLRGFGHNDQVAPDWITRVWDRWDASARNFHPVIPSAFSAAQRVSMDQLPSEIRRWSWPPGYIDEPPDDCY
jgi:hypothetical protein